MEDHDRIVLGPPNQMFEIKEDGSFVMYNGTRLEDIRMKHPWLYNFMRRQRRMTMEVAAQIAARTSIEAGKDILRTLYHAEEQENRSFAKERKADLC